MHTTTSTETNNTFSIPTQTMREVFPRLTPEEWGVLTCLLWMASSETSYKPTVADTAVMCGMKSSKVKKIVLQLRKMNLVAFSREPLTPSATITVNREPHTSFKQIEKEEVVNPVISTARVKCVSPATFWSDVKMSPSIRKVSYAFFQAMGLDVDAPERYIPNVGSWLFQSLPVAKLCDPDGYGMIDAAVRKLKASGMTISSPLSLVKTITAMKMATDSTNPAIEIGAPTEIQI